MERSFPWTTPTAGDGAAAFSQQQLIEWLRDSFTADQYATEGVLPGVAGELKVTGTSSPLSVAAGSAYVYGFYYQSTSATSVAVTKPNVGTTGGRVVLRADWSLQTVRIALKLSADGTSTIPALTQTASTTWEISLATFTITTGGTITLTDTRDFCHPGRAMIYRRVGGDPTNWNTPGSNVYTPGASRPFSGVATLTFSSSSLSNLLTVNFPAAYSGTPLVFPTLFNGGSTTGRKVKVTIESVSTNLFTARGYVMDGSTTSSSFDMGWLSLGPK